MFDQLPYVTELNNLTLKDVTRNGITDSKTLKKSFLVTGILDDIIQDSLDIITRDGNFNNVGIRMVLNLKEPNLMKKTNPVELVFKDKAKFDTQNPIISELFNQNPKTITMNLLLHIDLLYQTLIQTSKKV